MSNTDKTAGKIISCRISNSVIAYLESRGYDADAIIAGLPYTKDYLKSPYNWITSDEMQTISRRAARLANDDTIMYSVGLSSTTLSAIGGLESLIRMLTGPKTLFRSLSQYVNFFSKNTRMKVTFTGIRQATVVMRMKKDYLQTKDSCLYTQGLLSAMPMIWGLPPAEIHETKCMCRPDDSYNPDEVDYENEACVYKLSWQPLPSWFRRLHDNLFIRRKILSNYNELEHNLRVFDHKNAELVQRNEGLTQVREIALGVDKVRTMEEAFSLVAKKSRDIPGVSFVLIQKPDETGQYIITPYHSRARRPYVVATLTALGFDVSQKDSEISSGERFRIPLTKLKVAQDFLTNPRIIIKERLFELMGGIWSKLQCDSLQTMLGVKRFVIVPLFVDEKPWGGLLFGLEKDVPVDILEMVGAHCATAIKNIGTLIALEQRNRELSALNSIVSSTSKSLDVNTLLASGIGEISRIFSAQAVAVHLWDEKAKALRLVAQSGMPEAMAGQSRFIAGNMSALSRLFASQEDIMAGNMADFNSHYPAEVRAATKGRPVYFVATILRIGSSRYGMVTVARHNRQFYEEEKTLLLSITSQLSVAIENSKLHADVLRRAEEAELARSELENALNSLEKSEEELRCTCESVRDGITVTDLTGRVVKANEAALRMHGYEKEAEVIGINCLDIFAEERRAEVYLKLSNLLETETTGTAETLLLRKDGSKFPGEINASVLRNMSGKPLGFVTTSRDITARKQAEMALRESEEKYKVITENSVVGIYIIQNSKLVYVNLSTSRIFGYKLEEIIGILDPARLIHPDDFGSVMKKIGEKRDGITVEGNIQCRGVKKDGSVINIEAYARLIEFQGKPAMMGTFIDVTKRKQSEDNLKMQKDLIDRVLATIPNAVLVINKNSRIVMANHAFYNGFLSGEQGAEGKLLREVIQSNELNQAAARIWDDGEDHISREFRYIVAGNERIMIANIFAMQNEVLLVINDITYEREKQEKLYLTDRLASVGEMASGVAHELNNPLTTIIGLSRLLLKQDMPGTIKEDLTDINNEAQRAAKIISNLLTFARKHQPVRESVQINHIIEDVLKLRAYEHKVNNITVETDIPPDLPSVRVDYFQMQQVFLNIILNAEAAITDFRGRGTLRISGERVNGDVRVSFSDDGPGIASHNMGQLFTPFFTTKGVGKGTGLGLSICYGIVAAHGGNIRVESEEGKGADFIIELPVHDN